MRILAQNGSAKRKTQDRFSQNDVCQKKAIRQQIADSRLSLGSVRLQRGMHSGHLKGHMRGLQATTALSAAI